MELMERWLGEPVVWIAVNSLITTVAVIFCGWFLRDAADATNTRLKGLPPNDNKAAEEWFLRLLKGARREVIMYDDGDRDTLYDSPKVVAAIQKKLDELDKFEVRCMLNFGSGETLFERKFTDESRVKIYSRKGEDSRTHYKLFDNKVAYVSKHPRGAKARRRVVLYCPTRSLFSKHPVALRPYFKDFGSHATAA